MRLSIIGRVFISLSLTRHLAPKNHPVPECTEAGPGRGIVIIEIAITQLIRSIPVPLQPSRCRQSDIRTASHVWRAKGQSCATARQRAADSGNWWRKRTCRWRRIQGCGAYPCAVVRNIADETDAVPVIGADGHAKLAQLRTVSIAQAQTAEAHAGRCAHRLGVAGRAGACAGRIHVHAVERDAVGVGQANAQLQVVERSVGIVRRSASKTGRGRAD